MRVVRWHKSTAGEVTAKEERCRLAKCPLAGAGDPRCERCAGPVRWPDPKDPTVLHGCARACTSCAMNGLALPVCWAACPGPNENFGSDGEDKVTLGGMDDPDKYIGERISDEVAQPASVRRGGIGSGAEPERSQFEPMLVALAKRVLLLSGPGWDEFRAACARRDAKSAARASGAPLGAFRGPGGTWAGSAAERLVAQISGLDARGWEMARRLAMGDSQKRVADLTLVRKQAMNQRLKRTVRGMDWVGRLERTGKT